ncbi:MAG: SDR family NAD(P)-dependent oxidoreductase, partial [Pseudomonadota bacterium]
MTKAVLITGGAKRVGRAIALAAHRQGWRPIIHYNASSADAVALAEELGGFAVGHDLSVPGAGSLVVAQAREHSKILGAELCGLVNSASIFEHDTAANATEDDLLRNFRINALAPMMLAQAFAAEAPDGSAIVNMLDQKL